MGYSAILLAFAAVTVLIDVAEADENAEELGKEKSEIFHKVTAKLLYIMKRTRPDIETVRSSLFI